MGFRMNEKFACINCFDGNGLVSTKKSFEFQADDGTWLEICETCFPEMARKYLSDSELRSITVSELYEE